MHIATKDEFVADQVAAIDPAVYGLTSFVAAADLFE